ncbi:MAG: tetratricopeptide repeat protein, partial [Trueperaceae bacterium]|nr:tetratricopeptide repeat protein [Trueperaceae bacterium]
TLVLLLEDLHWLDPASAELLAELARTVPTLPVLVLTSARPLDDERERAAGDVSGAQVLRLGPLDEAAALAVGAARLAGAGQAFEVSDELAARIVERSGGNPFYLGELLTDLLQRAAQAGGRHGPTELSELPTSLHSLILGRLDRLELGALLSLKVASVVGKQFRVGWVSGCQAAVDDRAVDDGAAASAFAATDQAGLTERVAAEPPTHAFNHAITRDVTYDSLSHATRLLLHTRLGRFIERHVASASEPNLDLLAYHFALGDDAAKARHYLGAAGASAKAAYANEAAIDYFERLLALQEGAERLPTLIELGEVMTFVGAYGAAEGRLEAAAALAAAVGARPREAAALRLLGELYERQGDHGRAKARLEAAAGLCRELGDGAELTRVLLALGGNVLWHLGSYDEAEALLAEAVALARAAGDARVAARALHGTANIHLYRGEAEAAEAAFLASLELRREARDEYGVANALNNLAIVSANAGDGARAEELFAESLQIRERLGDVAGVAVALNNLGYMVAERGDLAGARALYERSLASRRELGDRLGLAVSLNNLAGLVARLGATEEARRLYLESVGFASAIDNGRETAAALAGLASVVAEGVDAARMARAAELLLGRIGAAVDEDVRTALAVGRARGEHVAVPARLVDGPLAAIVAWALHG